MESKKKYQKPTMEVVALRNNISIICTSPDDPPEGGDKPEGPGE